ncbi:MAG: tetratricopeptide repeat protein [Bacteroidota bacterium]
MIWIIKRFFIVLVFYSCCFASFAQQNGSKNGVNRGADSLRPPFYSSNSRVSDTSRINSLNMLACEIQNSNPDTAIMMSTEALRLATVIAGETKNPTVLIAVKKGIAKSYNNLGVFNLLKGNYMLTLDYHFKALEISESLDDKKGIAATSINLGIVFFDQGDYAKALNYYFKALQITEELNEKKWYSYALNNIANVFFEQKEYTKALDYYFKALKVAEELGDKDGIAIKMVNIGNVYRILALSEKVPALRDSLNEKALNYHYKALKMYEELENKNGIASAVSTIGTDYMYIIKSRKGVVEKDSLYKKALNFFSKALKMYVIQENKNGIAESYGNIGLVYFETKKYKEAEEYIQKSLAIAVEINAIDFVKDNHELLSVLYTQTHQPAKALEHYKKHIAARDSLFNEENTKEMLRSEMNFEFENKLAEEKLVQDKKNAIALEKLKQQRQQGNYFIIGFAIVLLFLFFIFRNYTMRVKAQKLFHLMEQKLTKNELEINKLEKNRLGSELMLYQEKLLSHTNLIKEKTRLLDNLQEQLDEIKHKNIGLSEQTAEYLLATIKENINSREYWEEFITNFNLVYKAFMDRLIEECPEISKNELKLCALIKSNLGNKEIANVINISPDSVKKAKARLKKKLKLKESESLTAYILGLNLI